MTFPKPYADLVMRLRVPSGFLLVAAFAWFAAPDGKSLAWGVPVSMAGLWIRAWAAGHLAKNQALATSGPYAWVRNPLYLGTLLVAAGLVIASLQWSLTLLFGAVFVLVYLPAIQQEEQHLRTLFPEYAEYSERVRALLPRAPAESSGERFRFTLYMKNQEYQALAGFLAGLCLLLWKARQ